MARFLEAKHYRASKVNTFAFISFSMTNQFTYSVLQYRGNHLSGESINVGLLFAFPNEGLIEFVAPSKFQRIEKVFPNSNSKDLKLYLRSFETLAKKAAKHIASYGLDLDSLIHDKFLIQNGSALFFNRAKTAPIWKSIPQTISVFTEQYLGAYGLHHNAENVQLKSEQYILKKYKSLLQTHLNAEQYSAFTQTAPIQVQAASISLQFDLHWQNGTHNLIKAVSLDLKSEEGIETKSLALSKRLDLLSEKLTAQNQRVDLLISKPTNKKFEQVFKHAVEFLKESKAPKKIIPEVEYQSYAQKVVETF